MTETAPIATPTPAAPAATASNGHVGTIVLATFALVLAAGIGYYFLFSKPKQTQLTPEEQAALDAKIKEIQNPNSQGNRALGVLTDPNFFAGLSNFTESIMSMVKEGKANKAANSYTQEYNPHSTAPGSYDVPSNVGVGSKPLIFV